MRGNPGHRPLNRSEPKPGGVATCPRELDDEAKKEWKRVASELQSQGMLTVVDRAALAAYCVCYSRWRDSERQLELTGTVVRSPKSGYPIQNPYVGIANTALDQMRKFLIEFGMTPASRSRLQIDPPASPDDKLKHFMQGIRTFGQDDNDQDESEAVN